MSLDAAALLKDESGFSPFFFGNKFLIIIFPRVKFIRVRKNIFHNFIISCFQTSQKWDTGNLVDEVTQVQDREN